MNGSIFPDPLILAISQDSSLKMVNLYRCNYDADKRIGKELKDMPWHVRKLHGCAKFLANGSYVRSVSPAKKPATKSSGIVDPFTDSEEE